MARSYRVHNVVWLQRDPFAHELGRERSLGPADDRWLGQARRPGCVDQQGHAGEQLAGPLGVRLALRRRRLDLFGDAIVEKAHLHGATSVFSKRRAQQLLHNFGIEALLDAGID